MRKSHLIALCLGLAAATAAVSAESDPKAVAEYRHQVFESLGKHMKATSMVVKGQLERPKADLVGHAKAMHETAKFLTGMFPKGTGPDAAPDTEALPKIWEDWKGFEAAAATFEKETAALVTAAESGDVAAFKAQFGKVGKACGDCHDGYRKDEG